MAAAVSDDTVWHAICEEQAGVRDAELIVRT